MIFLKKTLWRVIKKESFLTKYKNIGLIGCRIVTVVGKYYYLHSVLN